MKRRAQNRLAALARFAIYDGRDLLGSIAESDGEFSATNAAGEEIGRFTTLKAAASEIMRSRAKRRQARVGRA